MKALTKKEMADLDKAMVEIGIGIPMMMELAGLFVAMEAARMARRKKKKILVMAGTGNNGGDALVAARHLANWGYGVEVALATPAARLKPIPLHQWKILVKMKVLQKRLGKIRGYGLVVDGLLGCNIKGNPRDSYSRMIIAANNSGTPILSIDVPSGLDATTGRAYYPCIRASATIALTAAKKGLLKKSARKYTGKVFVAYMTVPRAIGRRFGLKNNFSEKNLISPLR